MPANEEINKYLTEAMGECWHKDIRQCTSCSYVEPHDLHCWVCSGPLIVDNSREAFITKDGHSATFCDSKRCQMAADHYDHNFGVPEKEKQRRTNKGSRHTTNDFFTWEGFGKLWEWAKKQEWWNSFYYDYEFYIEDIISPKEFAEAVYKYIKEMEG